MQDILSSQLLEFILRIILYGAALRVEDGRWQW